MILFVFKKNFICQHFIISRDFADVAAVAEVQNRIADKQEKIHILRGKNRRLVPMLRRSLLSDKQINSINEALSENRVQIKSLEKDIFDLKQHIKRLKVKPPFDVEMRVSEIQRELDWKGEEIPESKKKKVVDDKKKEGGE